jgi:single-strand DNA-binding protein
MANDINSVTIVGRITRDPELTYTGGGMAICKISIAVNRSKKQNDQWVEEASFFDVTLFGKRAESLQQYLTKGTQIAVQGSLKQDRWEQDGQKRSKVQIIADNIQLLGGKKDSTQESPYGQGSAQKPAQNDRFMDDVPF